MASPHNRTIQTIRALASLAAAAGLTTLAAAQPRADYLANDLTRIRHLAPTTEPDAHGTPRTAEPYERTALLCGGVVRIDAAAVRPVHPTGPLDPAVLAVDEPDPNAVPYTFGPPGGLRTGLTITYHVSGTLPAGALDALGNAALRYIATFDDTVDLHIDVRFTQLSNPNTLGSTTNKFKKFTYEEVRDAIVADADGDDTLLLSLPNTEKLDVKYDGGTIKEEKHVYLTRAQAKSIGLISPTSTSSDGKFKFNTDFSFDYDPTNGITIGRMDFEYVVTHELGHLLGFASGVDFRHKNIEGLDLYRFSLSDCPASSGAFTANPRTGGDDKQGVACSTCLPASDWGTWRMSTGVDGDGQQASHWRDDSITSTWTGAMDPTLGPGQAFYNTTGTFAEYLTVADARAFDALGWDWDFDTVAPGEFTLVSPPDGARIFTLTPTLDWTPAQNATNYNVQLYELSATYNSAGWTLLVEADTGFATSYNVPAGLLQRGKTYRWDVVAQSPWGSQWSDVWYFTVVQLEPSPVPSGFLLLDPPSVQNVSRNPSFTWQTNGADLVTMYLVEISPQPDFPSQNLIKLAVFPPFPPGQPLAELPPGILKDTTSYYWRVRAVNDGGETFGTPSEGIQFITGTFPPDAFGLLSPRPDARGSRTPLLQWQAAHEADAYDVQLATDSAFSDVIFEAFDLTEPHVSVPPGTLDPNSVYHWRVRAKNFAGNTLATPSQQSFMTLPPKPEPFTLLNPPLNSIIIDPYPELGWTNSIHAAGYLVEVDDDPNEGLSEVLAHTPFKTLPLDPLPRGRLYTWTVRAYNAAGQTDGTPEPSRFFVTAGDFDLDNDGARDLRDVAAFQRCYSLPSPWPPACGDYDAQGDGELTLIDLAVLLANLTGPPQ